MDQTVKRPRGRPRKVVEDWVPPSAAPAEEPQPSVLATLINEVLALTQNVGALTRDVSDLHHAVSNMTKMLTAMGTLGDNRFEQMKSRMESLTRNVTSIQETLGRAKLVKLRKTKLRKTKL